MTTTAYDADSNVTAMTNALSQTATFAYDALNRLVSTTDALGHTATVVFDAVGRPVGSMDPYLDVTQAIFDPLGRVIGAVDPRGNLTQTVFDAAGNTRAVIDPDNNQTSYVYDALNRQVLETDPNGATVTTSYDAASRVTSIVDQLSRTITYAYDAADRLTASTWLSATGSVVNRQTFTYDAASNPLTAGDNNGTYTMGYDALNRVTSEAVPYGVSLTFSYDAADRRTLVQDSLGGVLTSVYDAADRLTSRQFSGSGQQLRLDPGYNAINELTSLTRYTTPAGTTVVGTTVYGYDSADRLTAITDKNGSGTTLSYYNTAYDSANRATSDSWSSTVGTVTYGGTHTYTYDAASQLLTDSTATYSYDANGNRTMAGYQTGTENELTTDGVWTYTYDAAGNETQKTQGSGASAVTWKYGYDNQNRLVSAVELTGTTSTTAVQATYTYDVFGDRIQDSVYTSSSGLTTVTRHAYDGPDLIADINTSGGVLARYVYSDGVDQIWARAIPNGQPNAGVAWYLTDRLGSVRDLMDGTGALQDHLDYSGYGVVTESNASFGDHTKYAGGWVDAYTGEEQFDARWYDAATGRWLSQDPLGFSAGDASLYRYVGNDPINATDPSGLFSPVFTGGWEVETSRGFQDDYNGYRSKGLGVWTSSVAAITRRLPGFSSIWSSYEMHDGVSLGGSDLGRRLTSGDYVEKSVGIVIDVALILWCSSARWGHQVPVIRGTPTPVRPPAPPTEVLPPVPRPVTMPGLPEPLPLPTRVIPRGGPPSPEPVSGAVNTGGGNPALPPGAPAPGPVTGGYGPGMIKPAGELPPGLNLRPYPTRMNPIWMSKAQWDLLHPGEPYPYPPTPYGPGVFDFLE